MGERTCCLLNCGKPVHARGVCSHYMRCWRGEAEWPVVAPTVGPSYSDRFWSKVARREPQDCWLWLASKYPNGYGQFDHQGAHRVSYQLAIGPISDELVIDHRCCRRDCVNPAHLQPVTPAVNVQRGYAPPIAATRMREWSAARTHCSRGHELTPQNTYVTPKEGWRQCRICRAGRKKNRR